MNDFEIIHEWNLQTVNDFVHAWEITFMNHSKSFMDCFWKAFMNENEIIHEWSVEMMNVFFMNEKISFMNEKKTFMNDFLNIIHEWYWNHSSPHPGMLCEIVQGWPWPDELLYSLPWSVSLIMYLNIILRSHRCINLCYIALGWLNERQTYLVG